MAVCSGNRSLIGIRLLVVCLKERIPAFFFPSEVCVYGVNVMSAAVQLPCFRAIFIHHENEIFRHFASIGKFIGSPCRNRTYLPGAKFRCFTTKPTGSFPWRQAQLSQPPRGKFPVETLMKMVFYFPLDIKKPESLGGFGHVNLLNDQKLYRRFCRFTHPLPIGS